MKATASKSNRTAEPPSGRTSPHRARKIMTPIKEGTIKRSVIRKVVKDVIANRQASNEY